MARLCSALLLLPILAGCAGYVAPRSDSPCVAQGEASYACQIERYNRASG